MRPPSHGMSARPTHAKRACRPTRPDGAKQKSAVVEHRHGPVRAVEREDGHVVLVDDERDACAVGGSPQVQPPHHRVALTRRFAAHYHPRPRATARRRWRRTRCRCRQAASRTRRPRVRRRRARRRIARDHELRAGAGRVDDHQLASSGRVGDERNTRALGGQARLGECAAVRTHRGSDARFAHYRTGSRP